MKKPRPSSEEYRLARLECRAGDVIVARIRERHATADSADALRHYLRASIPSGVEILVIDETVDLSILRPGAQLLPIDQA